MVKRMFLHGMPSKISSTVKLIFKPKALCIIFSTSFHMILLCSQKKEIMFKSIYFVTVPTL